MKVEVRRLGILRTGVFLAAFYTLVIIIMAPFMLIGFLADAPEARTGILMMLMMVLMYPLIGFVGGIIMAAFYNFVAKIVGGMQMEMEVEPVRPTSLPQYITGPEGVGGQDANLI